MPKLMRAWGGVIVAVCAVAVGCGRAPTSVQVTGPPLPDVLPAPVESILPTLPLPMGPPSPESSSSPDPEPTAAPEPTSHPTGEPSASQGGYEAEPEAYVSQEDAEELGRAQLPVLLPTWLPEWTAGSPPLIYTTVNHGYVLSWERVYDLDDPITASIGSTLTLQVSAAFYSREYSERPTPDVQGEEREYQYDDVCTGAPINSDGRAVLYDVEPVAALSFDGPIADSYYSVLMVPGPECIPDVITTADLFMVADSLVERPY